MLQILKLLLLFFAAWTLGAAVYSLWPVCLEEEEKIREWTEYQATASVTTDEDSGVSIQVSGASHRPAP